MTFRYKTQIIHTGCEIDLMCPSCGAREDGDYFACDCGYTHGAARQAITTCKKHKYEDVPDDSPYAPMTFCIKCKYILRV